MSDLVEFLRARLNEDERLAKAAAPGPWHMDENQRIYAEDGAYVTAPWTEDERDDDLDHMVRHDPARVLREVEAKRRIVATFVELDTHPNRLTYAFMQQQWIALRAVAAALALPYADHPDYREE